MSDNRHFRKNFRATMLPLIMGWRSRLVPVMVTGLFLGGHATYVMAAPPQMPELFDKSAVEQLLASIDQGQNATILKFGYFLRRNPRGLPVKEGLALLQSAVTTEPVGSKRWFILQEIYGFAGLHAGDESKQAGADAYTSLFKQAGLAKQVGASGIVANAVRDFVLIVPGSYGGPFYGARGRETSLLALSAFLEHLKIAPETSYQYRWDKTIGLTYSDEPAIVIVQKYLDDPAMPKSYAFLRVAADIYEEKQPEQAIKLLQQAKPLLPAPQDHNLKETRAFYALLVNLLDAKGHTKEAIATQQELIALTKEGRGKLAVIYYANNDAASATPLLQALVKDGSDQEISKTASELWSLHRSSPYIEGTLEAGVDLMAGYLTAPRTRVLEYELRARVELGEYLLSRGKTAEARAMLSAPYNQPLPNRAAQEYYDTMQRMLEGQSVARQSTDKSIKENNQR